MTEEELREAVRVACAELIEHATSATPITVVLVNLALATVIYRTQHLVDHLAAQQ